jgi:NADP-dependent 3-hydroxy acid dehydrogenase YdfG
VPDRLTGTSAVVTGASRGIGLAVARALAANGAQVAMIARGADSLRAEAGKIGSRALAVACDLSRADHVADALRTIAKAFDDEPDVLVNNAGVFTVAPIADVDPVAFGEELDTTLVAPLRLVRAMLPGMRARRDGHIVTIGSVADRDVFPGNATYASSKHGARALHEVLRLETRGTGVRATLISPGPVDTPIWDPIDPDHRPGFTPRALMLRPDAVASAVIFALTQPNDVNIDELRLSRS